MGAWVNLRVEITARNVVNTKIIRATLEAHAARCVYPRGKKWITGNYYNWVVNHVSGFLLKYSPSGGIRNPQGGQITFPGEPWLIPALERGEEVYYIPRTDYISTPNNHNLRHVVDFLNTQDREWSRVSVPDMDRLIDDWDEHLKKQTHKNKKSNKDNFKHLFNSGRYQWVEILTPEGLEDEGSKMGHCVGGEDYCLQLGKGMRIFSLRDKNFDNPHVTIEMTKSGAIEQIQGKQNKEQPKYSSNVADFLNKVFTSGYLSSSPNKKITYHLAEELDRWEIFYHNDKFYSKDDRPNPLIFNARVSVIDFLNTLWDDRDIVLLKTKEISINTVELNFLRSLKVPNGTILYHQGSSVRIPENLFDKLQAQKLRLYNHSSKPIKIPSNLDKFKLVTLVRGNFLIPKAVENSDKLEDSRR